MPYKPENARIFPYPTTAKENPEPSFVVHALCILNRLLNVFSSCPTDAEVQCSINHYERRHFLFVSIFGNKRN